MDLHNVQECETVAWWQYVIVAGILWPTANVNSFVLNKTILYILCRAWQPRQI